MDESVAAARVKAILMLVGCVGAAQVDVEAWYDGRLAKGERAWHFCIGCDELVGPLGVESLLGKCALSSQQPTRKYTSAGVIIVNSEWES